MRLPLSLHIGLRYTRSKKRSRFVSFISLSSLIGIALGVAVLITVMSVMNGFDEQIRAHFFSIAPQVTVTTDLRRASQWKQLHQQVLAVPGVQSAAPFVSGKAMLSMDGSVSGAQVLGIKPRVEKDVSKIANKIIAGDIRSLQPGRFHVVLGDGIAGNLGIGVGDQVVVLTPVISNTPVGLVPRYKTFTVSAIFHDAGLQIDNGLAYINYDDAQHLFAGSHAAAGLHVKVHNLYDAPDVRDILLHQLGPDYTVSDWTMQFGAFFRALAMEKTMMFIILLLIIAVAAFNLVTGLTMMVNDKQADIAILRTMGATKGFILRTFITQGLAIGVIGTLLGVIFGILLSLNATAIVDWIQTVFDVQLISASVYMVDYLPSQLSWVDVTQISVIALLMSFLATLFPAWRAFKTQPAEALRYE